MNENKLTVKGTIWSMIERFSTMGTQLLCTLAIAQFLNPSQFGLVSMMSVFLSFAMVMAECGFGQAIIREKNVTELDYNSIFFFNILLGFIIYIIAFFAAPLIAKFYCQAELTDLVRVSFLSIIINSFTIVQEAQLYKSVNFSKVSKISLISVVLSSLIGIVIAIIYRNVWALVFQSLFYALIKVILYWIYSTWHPHIEYSWASVKKYLSFSLNLLGSRLIASITDNLANLFIGKAYKAEDLGNFTVPDKLQRSVAGTISFAIHRVSYPVMATFQDDVNAMKAYSQKVVGMAFYITAPIMIYLLIVSPDLFSIILSPQWANSAIYFRYMCIIGAIFCFADINMDILLVKGKSKLVLLLEIVRKTVLVLSLIVGINYSMKIFLIILVLYNVCNTVLINYYAGKEVNCSLWQQLLNVLPTITCNVVAWLITTLVVSVLNNKYIVVICGFVVYFAVYFCISFLTKNRYLIFIRKTVTDIITS